MTQAQQYRRGLEKLKLWRPGERCDWYHCLIPHEFAGRMHEDHEIPAIDLRRDPAFAWRVLGAWIKYAQNQPLGDCYDDNVWTWLRMSLKCAATPEEYLYRAICALGEGGES